VDKIVEGTQRLVDGDLSGRPVNVVHVDVVGLQPTQRRVAFVDHMATRATRRVGIVVVHARVELAGQH
jgi:hypothetical protein